MVWAQLVGEGFSREEPFLRAFNELTAEEEGAELTVGRVQRCGGEVGASE